MQSIKNTVQLIGNVGCDPRIRSASNGTKQADVTIAINESYKNGSGDKITETHWHSLVALGKIAELIEQRITKGSKIAIEGKLCSRSFINKDGVKVHKTEIHVRELLILEQNNAVKAEG